MWNTENFNEFVEWVQTNHPDKVDLVNDWMDRAEVVPCDINENTGKDYHLVNSVRNSITNRLIETGTEAGSFTLNFVNDASEIITCEVDEGSYLCAQYRHQDHDNIDGRFIDSKSLLESLELRDDDVFFLDAHGGPDGYDLINDNPLTHELNIIRDAGIKPTIFIHDFGIETDKNPDDGNYWHHPSLPKVYEYRFDFDATVYDGWKLDWDFIRDEIEEIYGDDYVIEYPPFEDDDVVVGWIKISAR